MPQKNSPTARSPLPAWFGRSYYSDCRRVPSAVTSFRKSLLYSLYFNPDSLSIPAEKSYPPQKAKFLFKKTICIFIMKPKKLSFLAEADGALRFLFFLTIPFHVSFFPFRKVKGIFSDMFRTLFFFYCQTVQNCRFERV